MRQFSWSECPQSKDWLSGSGWARRGALILPKPESGPKSKPHVCLSVPHSPPLLGFLVSIPLCVHQVSLGNETPNEALSPPSQGLIWQMLKFPLDPAAC